MKFLKWGMLKSEFLNFENFLFGLIDNNSRNLL